MGNNGSGRRPAGAIAGVAILVALASAAPGASADVRPQAPVPGGHLVVSGDAEVGNPWTPAAMRCDSYCYTRARTFFDSVAVFGDDGQVHGMLAESIEPNDDFTEWTITIRDGITFTDGTPVNAAAVIYNLQATGTGALVSATLKDVAKVPHPDDPDRMILKIEQLDELTFVDLHRRRRRPAAPAAVAQLPAHARPASGVSSPRRSGSPTLPRTPNWPPDRSAPARSSSTATSRAVRWRSCATPTTG